MPVKGLVLILLLVVVFALIDREQIYSWLQDIKREDDETKEYVEDEKE